MNKTYKIIAYAAVFPMTFSFYKIDDENEERLISLKVDVDYMNQKVHFGDNINLYPDLDFVKLEEEILEELTPKEIDTSEFSEQLIDNITNFRNREDYIQDIMKNVDGSDDDSRQS